MNFSTFRFSFLRFRWSSCCSKLTPAHLIYAYSLHERFCALSLSLSLRVSTTSPLANHARAINLLVDVCACKYKHKAQQRVIIDECGASGTHGESNSNCGNRMEMRTNARAEHKHAERRTHRLFLFCRFYNSMATVCLSVLRIVLLLFAPASNVTWMPWKCDVCAFCMREK